MHQDRLYIRGPSRQLWKRFGGWACARQQEPAALACQTPSSLVGKFSGHFRGSHLHTSPETDCQSLHFMAREESLLNFEPAAPTHCWGAHACFDQFNPCCDWGFDTARRRWGFATKSVFCSKWNGHSLGLRESEPCPTRITRSISATTRLNALQLHVGLQLQGKPSCGMRYK